MSIHVIMQQMYSFWGQHKVLWHFEIASGDTSEVYRHYHDGFEWYKQEWPGAACGVSDMIINILDMDLKTAPIVYKSEHSRLCNSEHISWGYRYNPIVLVW